MIETDSVITSSYPYKTMQAITLAVIIPIQTTEKKAIITLHIIRRRTMNAKDRDIAMP